MGFGQLELAGRAQHALTLDAAQLAHLDQKGFTVLAGRQLGTDQGDRHLDTNAGIRRATDDIEQLRLSHIDLAHAQTVRIGVLHRLLDFAHNDVAKRRRDGLDLFNFKAGHGERFGQLLGGQGRVAEFAQPGFGELHSGVIGIATESGYHRQKTNADRSLRNATW